MCLSYSITIATGLQNSGAAINPGLMFTITTVAVLTGGTMFLMWLGEQITSRGVGNGVSLIIFAGIVARLPSAVSQLLTMSRVGSISGFLVLLLAIMAVGVIVVIVCMERS